jgi:hypothetical protein
MCHKITRRPGQKLLLVADSLGTVLFFDKARPRCKARTAVRSAPGCEVDNAEGRRGRIQKHRGSAADPSIEPCAIQRPRPWHSALCSNFRRRFKISGHPVRSRKSTLGASHHHRPGPHLPADQQPRKQGTEPLSTVVLSGMRGRHNFVVVSREPTTSAVAWNDPWRLAVGSWRKAALGKTPESQVNP